MKLNPNIVSSGLDVLIRSNFKELKGLRVGIIANHSAVDSSGRHLVDILSNAPQVKISKLFSPEHGFRGEAQDMEQVGYYKDSKTLLPVVSLYGASESSLTPSLADLEDLDCILFDIQDVGARYYTFANTLAYTMKVAAQAGKQVLVLDRVNPIGGRVVEGSPLHNSCQSFCGYAPVANRHGMTVAELARLFNQGFCIAEGSVPALNCELKILEVEGWSRNMLFDETNLPWVFPSPNMPCLETALVYPGSCLFEATNISEGRGTTKPFELIGAPFVDSDLWIAKSLELYQSLGGQDIEGFFLRPTCFLPKFQKWAGQTCDGVQIHLRDNRAQFSYRLGLAMIAAAASLWPKDFSWRKDAYEFKDNISAIDILYGSSSFRQQIEQSPENLSGIRQEIEEFEAEFLEARKDFLLY